MKDTELIDYAHPMMMAENALRDAYDALLHGDSDKGIEHLLNAMVEVKMALNAVRHMQENQR
jgi:hypothetical protein